MIGAREVGLFKFIFRQSNAMHASDAVCGVARLRW